MMNNFIKKTKEIIKSFLKDPLFLRHWEDPWHSRRRDDNRISIDVRSWHRRKPYIYKGDGHMFVEDMYTGLMPFMIYRGEREKYPVRTEPIISVDRTRMLAQAISNREHTFSLEDGLCEFVRNTAHSLFIDGVVFYEIICQRNQAGEIENFSLEHIPPFRFFRVFNHYYQFVLWGDAKEPRIRVQIARIPAKNIVRIDFPKEYGGKRSLFSALKRMWQLSKEITPEFYMQAMSKNEDVGFNFETYTKAKYLEIAKVTKQFGWNQRQRSENNITEYYSMLRFLKEKKLEAAIRQLIIFKLNEVLNRPPLSLNVHVAMENLFTVEAVEEQEEKMKTGNVKFMDIFNSLKI